MTDSSKATIIARDTKSEILPLARQHARNVWVETEQLTQLVIHKKNGRIETEYTYGRDPKRFKG